MEIGGRSQSSCLPLLARDDVAVGLLVLEELDSFMKFAEFTVAAGKFKASASQPKGLGKIAALGFGIR